MESLIDDVALLERIAELSERGDDPTGNWIGGGRPRTNYEGSVGSNETLAKNFARWSAIHYSFYEALVAMDPVSKIARLELLALDLGCAGGARTRQIARHYGSTLGLDRSKKAIDFAVEFNLGPYVAYRRADWPCNAGQMHRIFAVEVFEHFAPQDQANAIRAALQSLTKDGLLFMTMPNEPPQPAPHQGTVLDEGFETLIHGVGGTVIHRGHFDNDAPGDPCEDGWSPIGPKHSHHFAVLAR
jgi:SAM-dependent methyltransferase